MKKKGMIAGLIFAALATGAAAQAQTGASGKDVETAASPAPSPTASPLKIAGFLQSWLSAGNSVSSAAGGASTLFGGALLKHLRLNFSGEPAAGMKVVALPELAGGVILLDGYAAFDFGRFFLKEASAGPLLLTAGQFKTPFGLNRMYTPTQLVSVDYSTINKGLFGTGGGSAGFWDDGLMATLNLKPLRLDFAAVEGLGPNQLFNPPSGFGLRDHLDYCGRLEFSLGDGRLLLGASYYYGTLFTTPGTQEFAKALSFTGFHLKVLGGPRDFALEGEFIQRSEQRFGVNGQVSRWVGTVQPFAAYEHVEDLSQTANNTTRWLAGANWVPSGSSPLRLTLEILAEAAGPGQAPDNTKGVFQSQVVF